MSEQPLISIAVGDSCDAKIWRNETWSWDQFKNKCQSVKRTPETFQQFIAAPTGQQTKIKDVGGFVAAQLAGGRRGKNTVVCRSMVTLDADHAAVDTWLNFKSKISYAALMHTTHKHTADKPRFRIIIPLAREVTVDEYRAIAALLSEDIGMEYMDHTGVDTNRLMFWPSASIDAPFEFDEVKGEFLNPDDVLARYADWTDQSSWPRHPKEHRADQDRARTQQNPNDKKDWVGAFCRAYTWDEVFDEFTPGLYVPCDIPNRYTYTEGTTSAGVIMYEDNFLFSHHSSDPISGVLCNKFDFVRIHKFGHLDKDDSDKPDTTPNEKRPSYLAMRDLCRETPTVRAQLLHDRMQEHLDDFADLLTDVPGATIGTPPPDPTAWTGLLEVDKQKAIVTCSKNIQLILENDPLIAGKIVYNQFTNTMEVKGTLPWNRGTDSCEWNDDDWASLKGYFGRPPYNMQRSAKIDDEVYGLRRSWGYHPVKDYLESCKWDGVYRLERVFIDYLGAEDSEYVRQVTRKSLIACVARIYQPGIKFDYAPMLIGPQGIGKSTIIEKMGGKWFSDAFDFHMLNNGGKQAIEQIHGVWIVEVGEMSGYKSIESKAAKRFLSAKADKARPAYGRETVKRERQCVFWPTSNERHPLTGSDGNRRFWVIDLFGRPKARVSPFDMTEQDRAQIWAEAMYYWHVEGEDLYLSEEMEEEARRQQKGHESQDEREGLIRQYLDMKLPENWDKMNIHQRQSFIRGTYEPEFDAAPVECTVVRERVCAVEIWVELFDKHKGDMDNHKVRFIHEALKNIEGWEPYTGSDAGKERFPHYGVQRSYRRVPVKA